MGTGPHSIGAFARLSGLTARALRLYDESGLLRPDGVDETTGYRSYSDGQLARAQLISALRSAGVPLAAVAEVVDASTPADAHAALEHWWSGVRAEHEAAAALVPRIHELLDARSDDMHDDHDGGDGQTPLLRAARAATDDHAIPSRRDDDALREVRALLESGADPSAADAEGWTPLHTAGISGHEVLAELLLAAGARTDAVVGGCVGATPLSYALFYAHSAAAAVIASADGGPVPDDLRTAAGLGDLVRVRRWLGAAGRPPLPEGAGAGLAFGGPMQWFPRREGEVTDQLVLDESLTWAARSGHVEVMAVLVDAGAEVNASPYRGTPLLWAIYSDAVAAAEWLLDHGADPDLRHDFGGADHGVQAVAMHLAAQYGSLGCLRLLLDRGADATITDGAHGATPLGWARFGEQPEAVAMLEG